MKKITVRHIEDSIITGKGQIFADFPEVPQPDMPTSAEQALQMYDVQCALKSYTRTELREVLAELPTKTLLALYAELTDIMA